MTHNLAPQLIVFEGIDNSGKSTLAQRLWKGFSINEMQFCYDREPHFTSADADRLNFAGLDPWQREFYFLKDRLEHQETLQTTDTILDRYILSGLVYSSIFSPQSYEMAKSIYVLPDFKQPDCLFLIDISPEDSFELNKRREGTPEANPKYTLELAKKLREAYYTNLTFLRDLNIPFFIVKSEIGKLDFTYTAIKTNLKFLYEHENLSFGE